MLKRKPAEMPDDVRPLRDAIRTHLLYSLGKTIGEAEIQDWYFAVTLAVRDRVTDRWLKARSENKALRKKRVYYLSIEFLIGRLLADALTNLGASKEAQDALESFGVSFDDVRNIEPDAALGNGGLGRLAACYMDSMTALGIPAYGYGIRYEHGLFAQSIRDGWQVERPEQWLKMGNPWELPRSQQEYPIGFGGAVEYVGDQDPPRANWYPSETVIASAHDMPLIGWRGAHANMLRLWGAQAVDPIHLAAFNEGDHAGAMASRLKAEAITRILYPGDHSPQGQELRLRQEYFFTAASLGDIVRRHMQQIGDIRELAAHAAIQLNDTHPAIAVAELMRVLVDIHGVAWDEAWTITRNTISFTNHTLLPEALETWPISLFGRILPRHLQIIYLINWYHLRDAASQGATDLDLAGLSIIDEAGEKSVRMAHLAFVGAHHVNGVSALHTRLLEKTLFKELSKFTTTKIVNQTNGISFRRWLFEANPELTQLMIESIGPSFLDRPEEIARLEKFSRDPAFVERVGAIRLAHKQKLARIIRETSGVSVDPSSLFDTQIKRIHEYKRQYLNLLHAIAHYAEIRANPNKTYVPRVKIIAGKAAPGYARAKLLIKLAHDVARLVNSDPLVGDRLKLVFLPNYNVSLAERMVPAADLSEQISTAGMEASGTGNMKMSLNGALTIGTLDGANIEIRENVGEENFFLFGLTAEEVNARRSVRFEGVAALRDSEPLHAAVEILTSSRLSPDDPGRYAPLVETLIGYDPFMVAADFQSYWQVQQEVDRTWLDPAEWWNRSILNTARMSWFSSDRAVSGYASDIWAVPAPHAP